MRHASDVGRAGSHKIKGRLYDTDVQPACWMAGIGQGLHSDLANHFDIKHTRACMTRMAASLSWPPRCEAKIKIQRFPAYRSPSDAGRLSKSQGWTETCKHTHHNKLGLGEVLADHVPNVLGVVQVKCCVNLVQNVQGAGLEPAGTVNCRT